jgi:hypothetical protein
MTKIQATALVAVLLLAGTRVASASCVGDAAASRQECLANGPRDRATIADCSASYRDDLTECHRFEHAPMTPVHKPPQPVPSHR